MTALISGGIQRSTILVYLGSTVAPSTRASHVVVKPFKWQSRLLSLVNHMSTDTRTSIEGMFSHHLAGRTALFMRSTLDECQN